MKKQIIGVALSLLPILSQASSILSHDKEIGLYQTNKATTFIKDNDILSPKSAHWINGSTLSINALERGATVLYGTNTSNWKKVKTIEHKFKAPQFQTISNYSGKIYSQNFMGKPVEITSNKDYMWIPYYRFSWDTSSREGSAIAQVNMTDYSITHLLPAGNIPKMVTLSHNEKLLASTHWGDNTIGIYELDEKSIPISYSSYTIERKLPTQNIGGDRDKNCGFCLRGTIFTKDDKYLIIGRMGGGGLAIVDLENKKYVGTVRNVPATPRHLVLSKDGKTLYISTSFSGQVAKIDIDNLINNWKTITLKDWSILTMGSGVRTIALSNDEKYLYATLNSSSQVAVVSIEDFKIIEKQKVASFPVGLAVSPDDKYIAITSQGKSGQGGGNHVDIFIRNDKR